MAAALGNPLALPLSQAFASNSHTAQDRRAGMEGVGTGVRGDMLVLSQEGCLAGSTFILGGFFSEYFHIKVALAFLCKLLTTVL